MSAAVRQILWVYVSRSWPGTAYMSGSVAFLLYLVASGELPLGLWIFELFIVLMIVGSRLTSVRTYALAFMAPDYRRRHFNVAIVCTVLLGWLPAIATAQDVMSLAQMLTLCVVATGVVFLLGHRDQRTMGFFFIGMVVFCLGFFFAGVPPRWSPPPLLMVVLLSLGTFLLVVFRREFVDGAEYDPILAAASEVHRGSGWVVTHRVRQADMNRENPVSKLFGPRWLEEGIARCVAAGQAGLPRLLSLGAGDTLFWRKGWRAPSCPSCWVSRSGRRPCNCCRISSSR